MLSIEDSRLEIGTLKRLLAKSFHIGCSAIFMHTTSLCCCPWTSTDPRQGVNVHSIQVGFAFRHIEGALNYLVDNLDKFSSLAAVSQRLDTLLQGNCLNVSRDKYRALFALELAFFCRLRRACSLLPVSLL